MWNFSKLLMFYKGTKVTHICCVFVLNAENLFDYLNRSILKLHFSKDYTKTNDQYCVFLQNALREQSTVILLPLMSSHHTLSIFHVCW